MNKPAKPALFGPDGLLAITRRNINIRSYGVISGIMGARVVDALPLRLRCECPMPGCEEIIEILLSKRRQIRRQFPIGFIVVLLHASPSTKMLYQTEKYSVVEMAGFNEAVVDL